VDLLSPTYVAFVALAAFFFHICPERWRSPYLAAVSLTFYSFFSVISAAIMLLLTLLTWMVAYHVAENRGARRARFELWAAVGIEASYLAFLKSVPLLQLKHSTGGLTDFLIGFGTSYYTFKLIGYLLDVYWDQQCPLPFFRLLAITAFFPQLPAGPIQRTGEFRWVEHGTQLPVLMVDGFRRILLGFVKKMAIADQLGAMVAMIAGNPHYFSHQQWLLFYLYPAQLYADFSALTDIAIGAAALFGIKSPENFALPFFAPNITQYWRRWHMTLTRWLTDYVFTPLRMLTRDLGEWGLSLSLTLNMTLIGLWHGFNLGFLLCGLIHACYLIADALSGSLRRRFYRGHRFLDRITDIAGPIIVYHLVALSLVFFRDETVSGSLYTLRHVPVGLVHPMANLSALMYSFGRLQSLCALIALSGFCILEFATLLLTIRLGAGGFRVRFRDLPRPLRWACYCAAIVGTILLHRQSAEFIYVQF
jgi:D-alanyl-lipoteichoic acid acyltransferase DltB (MBOAT superfamily)